MAQSSHPCFISGSIFEKVVLIILKIINVDFAELYVIRIDFLLFLCYNEEAI